jgi:mRNA-degrading endonuclease RelE of RelBE toxin-antitoxin system
MTFILEFTREALADLNALKQDPSKKRILKDVIKTLRLMETNLRHPSLNTHEFHNFKGPNGEKVFEAYAQQNTPGAYRIFWYYGPGKNIVSIVTITPHP